MVLTIKAIVGQLLLSIAGLAAVVVSASAAGASTADFDVFSFPNKKFTDQNLAFRSYSIPFLSTVQQLRGGNLSDDEYDYDNNDNDDDDDKDDDNDFIYSSKRPPSSRRQPATPRNNRGLPPRPRYKKSKHWTQRMASQSLQMGGKLAWNTVKQPGKLAYHLIRPKHFLRNCTVVRILGGGWPRGGGVDTHPGIKSSPASPGV